MDNDLLCVFFIPGGSLMSLGSKEKASLKNFAKSVSKYELLSLYYV